MKKSPIILIPGIQGTKLNNTNETDFKLLWSGLKKFFSDIHKLTLKEDGVSDAKSQVVVERADVENLAYSEIVNYLRDLGYEVYIFGYDWRKSNAYIAEDLAMYVERLKRKLGNSTKFNFLTHSMGALVLSGYLKNCAPVEIDKVVHKIIFTVPPFLGSLEATFNLIIGKSRFFNSSDDFRKVGRTFPGLYELLPVFEDAFTPNVKDYFNFDSYWQHKEENANTPQNKLIRKRLKHLKEVRNENNFIFDFSKLSGALRNKMIVLAGGGEDTKTKIKIERDQEGYRFLYDFEKFGEKKDGGDGTVPLESSTAFKDSIDTYRIDTSWIEKRVDSRYIQNDWHAFFLNNSRVQNIIKRFFDPKFEENENWYQSVKKNVTKL